MHIEPGYAIQTQAGGNTYIFPRLEVAPSGSLIKSVTFQFTTSNVTSSDVISIKAASGFSLYSGNKPVNVSVNANGSGATAEAWQRYLRENLTITFGSGVIKPIRMIASADPVDRTLDYNSANGHYYETVASKVNWEVALAAAKQKRYLGKQGYLVTVTSKSEHDYIYNMVGVNCWMSATCWNTYTSPVKSKYASFYASKGITIPSSTYTTSSAYYFWVDGPEAGQLISYGAYKSQTAAPDISGTGTIFCNWAADEPNNWMGLEYVGHFYKNVNGQWNDTQHDWPADAYVIEYGGMDGDETGTTEIEEIEVAYPLKYDLAGGNAISELAPESSNYAGYHPQSADGIELSDVMPTRAGYTFMGWSEQRLSDAENRTQYDSNASSVVTEVVMDSTSKTVYATWAKNPTITYSASSDGSVAKTEVVAPGGELSYPEIEAPVGYHVEWDRDIESSYQDETITYSIVPTVYTLKLDRVSYHTSEPVSATTSLDATYLEEHELSTSATSDYCFMPEMTRIIDSDTGDEIPVADVILGDDDGGGAADSVGNPSTVALRMPARNITVTFYYEPWVHMPATGSSAPVAHAVVFVLAALAVALVAPQERARTRSRSRR